MKLSTIIKAIPFWYWAVSVIFATFYAARGVIEQRVLQREWLEKSAKWYEKYFIIYIQEILFKFTATMSGFISLFMFGYIFPSPDKLKDIDSGMSLLLIFLFVWGITGVTGYLTLFISRGKIPGK
jgi:hypothetical protein